MAGFELTFSNLAQCVKQMIDLCLFVCNNFVEALVVMTYNAEAERCKCGATLTPYDLALGICPSCGSLV